MESKSLCMYSDANTIRDLSTLYLPGYVYLQNYWNIELIWSRPDPPQGLEDDQVVLG
jgi:hypothetical protein